MHPPPKRRSYPPASRSSCTPGRRSASSAHLRSYLPAPRDPSVPRVGKIHRARLPPCLAPSPARTIQTLRASCTSATSSMHMGTCTAGSRSAARPCILRLDLPRHLRNHLRARIRTHTHTPPADTSRSSPLRVRKECGGFALEPTAGRCRVRACGYGCDSGSSSGSEDEGGVSPDHVL